MGPFLPLFSVKVEHAFFADGVCKGLRLLPTASTSDLLSRARCLVRPTPGGVIVACDTAAKQILRDQCRDADDALRVEFLARAPDDQFANYTDRAPAEGASLLHFDSDGATLDPVTSRWRLAATSRANQPPRQDHESMRAAMTPSQRLPAPAFSVSIAVAAADVDAIDQAGKTYCCALAARTTIWKYYLLGDWTALAEELQIVDLGQHVLFETAVVEPLSNGQSAWVVRSKSRIPLQYRSDQRFQLRQRNGGSDKVLVKRLPVPSSSGLSRESLAGVPTLVSEIYVHR
jgi:hypothetical protein